MNPLLFILFGLAAVGVIIVLARDRNVARDRTAVKARTVSVASAAVILLMLVLIFTGVFTGPTAQVIVTSAFLVVAAVMFVALWLTYRKSASERS